MTTHYNHPQKILVPVTEALASWTEPGGIVMQKMDGEFAPIQVEDFIITAEKVRGDGIYAFDLVRIGGEDITCEPLSFRWAQLKARFGILADQRIGLVPAVDSRHGATLLQSVLDAGGEGGVLKQWSDTYHTPMLAAKRGGIWVCRVSSVSGSQSVGIVDAETGQDRGRVTMAVGKVEKVKVGSVIRVEGMNLTAAGKIRQPVAARCWLVSY